MNERFGAAAKLYDAAAEELDQAAAHCRTAARHFRDGEVPRAAAHAADRSLDDQAREHARRSTP